MMWMLTHTDCWDWVPVRLPAFGRLIENRLATVRIRVVLKAEVLCHIEFVLTDQDLE
jgi:hypothetical protein